MDLNYTLRIKEFCEANGLRQMDIVRIGGVAVPTAYRIWNGENDVTLDTVWRIYVGMRKQGLAVDFCDLVDFPDIKKTTPCGGGR